MRKIYSLILFLSLTHIAKAQMISVSTDALWLAAMAPNIGAELTIGEKSTIALNYITLNKPWGKYAHANALQPEYRYYFKSRPMNSVFVGLGGLAVSYDAKFNRKDIDGYAFGAGLTFGYVLPITERINVDFHAGYGAVFYKHKEHWVNDSYDNDFFKDGEVYPNAHGCYLVPTRIGISVSYIIK